MTQNKNSKIAITVLAILFILSLGYNIYSKINNDKFTKQLNTEKTEIKTHLDKMIAQYDVEIKKNGALSNDLKTEKVKITQLRDSIVSTKHTDYRLIRHLRNKLKSLEKLNKKLFYLADSTQKANTQLTQALDSSVVIVETQKDSIKTLQDQNVKLTKIVNDAAALRLYAMTATGIKLKKNGRLVITTRARRANRIRVCVRIAKNILSEKGNRDLYVQITNPKGKILGKDEVFTLGEKIQKYSDKTNFFYQNINTKICLLIGDKTKNNIVSGTYKIKVFAEDNMLGTLDFSLR